MTGQTVPKEFTIPTLIEFLRNTPSDLLQRYFQRIYVGLPSTLDWEKPGSVIGKELQRFVEEAGDGDRQRVMDDADRIGGLADEAGQSALLAVTPDDRMSAELPNGYARAVWTFLNSPTDFEHAEQVRYADDRRYGRIWDGFLCEPGCIVARDGAKLDHFKQAVRERFDSRNAEVEICDRMRPKLEQDASQLVQAAIYREGRPSTRKAFVNGSLDRLPDHPVIEAAVTYESMTGVIEVVAQDRESREDLVRVFAEHLLSIPFQGRRLKVREYALDRLRRPFEFPTDPEDNIEGVRLNLLRLMPLDTGGERLTLESMRGAERSIWDMARVRFDAHDPLRGGYRVTKARFTIKFRPIPGARGGRTLPVTISMPKGCDLKDRTDRERLIGDKYLRRWNLLRDV